MHTMKDELKNIANLETNENCFDCCILYRIIP